MQGNRAKGVRREKRSPERLSTWVFQGLAAVGIKERLPGAGNVYDPQTITRIGRWSHHGFGGGVLKEEVVGSKNMAWNSPFPKMRKVETVAKGVFIYGEKEIQGY